MIEKISLIENFDDERSIVDFIIGLYLSTKDLVNNKAIMQKIFGYATGRLFEEAVEECKDTMQSSESIQELEEITLEYRQFRSKNFVKPQLNRDWPKNETYLKQSKVYFAGKPSHYKDFNKIESLIRKLGGIPVRSVDSSVLFAIIGKGKIPKNVKKCKNDMTEYDFSEIVKTELPQIPKDIVTQIRNESSFYNIENFKKQFSRNKLEEVYTETQINFIYQEVEYMFSALNTSTGSQHKIYKLTRWAP